MLAIRLKGWHKMSLLCENWDVEKIREQFPEKFAPEETIFSKIHPGDRIFIGTACGEPQYLVRAMIQYVETNPAACFDAEILHVWTFGIAPYTNEKFKRNFRHNSFFIGENTRNVVNTGLADYTPIFLSKVPALFRRRVVPIDVALIQTSPPDDHGYMSLGVSVDIVKSALENASLVITQVNSMMPRVHGNSFVHVKDVDYIVPYDEELLEFESDEPDESQERIGEYVSQIVEDGDTIQVGYGSLPNAILKNLCGKKHLGVHTDILGEGIVQLMKAGVVDNSKKYIDRGKTIAAFCMGKKETYEFIHDNPAIEFRTVDYTNNPMVIASHRNMVAINSALEIDLTGQANSESIGKSFYSGIGGLTDFMRGAVLARKGKTILAMRSTANDDQISKIVPFLKEGAGVTLTRGDIDYVVTEYGRAYLQGKNVRERAMALISIAHPKFRPWLIEEAKKAFLIYADQSYIFGKKGEYPAELEAHRTTKNGLEIFLRPVKISDESLLKDFFYSLSDQSKFRRFMSLRKDMPHEILQNSFVVIDYTIQMEILAVVENRGAELVVGIVQYGINEGTLTAEVGIVVRDDYENFGIGTELLSYAIYLAQKQGLHGLTAEVLHENLAALHLFKKMGFDIKRGFSEDVFIFNLTFKNNIDQDPMG